MKKDHIDTKVVFLTRKPRSDFYVIAKFEFCNKTLSQIKLSFSDRVCFLFVSALISYITICRVSERIELRTELLKCNY